MSQLFTLSKKGISTAIGSVFLTILIIMTISATLAIEAHHNDYYKVRDEVFEQVIKNESESLDITDIVNPSNDSDYTFDIELNNEGGVLTEVVRIYIYDNDNKLLFGLYDRQNATGGIGFTGGYLLPGDGGHIIKINATDSLDNSTSYRYTITVCTERGNQFNYDYPKPWETPTGEGYPLVIVSSDDNFQFTYSGDFEFKSAHVKAKGTTKTLYRVLINNTTDETIYLQENCTMLQLQGAVGEITERFIVQDNSSSEEAKPETFVNQTLDPGSMNYLYFGASTVGGDIWQNEPNKTGYYIISFILWYRYEGESDIRTIGTFAIVQELK
jgi:hypothetical protein